MMTYLTTDKFKFWPISNLCDFVGAWRAYRAIRKSYLQILIDYESLLWLSVRHASNGLPLNEVDEQFLITNLKKHAVRNAALQAAISFFKSPAVLNYFIRGELKEIDATLCMIAKQSGNYYKALEAKDTASFYKMVKENEAAFHDFF